MKIYGSSSSSSSQDLFAAAERRVVVAFSAPPIRSIASQPTGQWAKPVLDRLTVLCALERGWDGYDGKPVRFDIAQFAFNMLMTICSVTKAAPQIVPGPAGDLQLEWHFDNGSVELDVRAPNDVLAWRSTPNGGEELMLQNDLTRVIEWIKAASEPAVAALAATG